MQKTTTFLMFTGANAGKAKEAITLYTSLFKNSEITSVEYFKEGEPGGKVGFVKHGLFTLAGNEYHALDSAMDHGFTFTPAVSIFVNCDSNEEITTLYNTLLEGGQALMPLNNYGFSKQFGWIADRYGLSWQLTLA